MHNILSSLKKIPAITVHGRFQPPIHINHWEYIRAGFDRADHVTILITNPFQDEAFDAAASWRNDPQNNPFSFDERKYMLELLLVRLGIDILRFNIKPFNIKNPESFRELDVNVPNLVNVYSEWSSKKDNLFKDHGLSTIRLEMPKTVDVSGTLLRQTINDNRSNLDRLGQLLVKQGLIGEALPGLLEVLASKAKHQNFK